MLAWNNNGLKNDDDDDDDDECMVPGNSLYIRISLVKPLTVDISNILGYKIWLIIQVKKKEK